MWQLRNGGAALSMVACLSLLVVGCRDVASSDCDTHPCAAACRAESPEMCESPPACDAYCDPCDANCEPCDATCEPTACDALCDPCTPGCVSCNGRCETEVNAGGLAPVRCDATPESPPETGDGAGRWKIAFEPPPNAPSWLLSVFGDDMERVVGVSLRLPDGHEIDLDTRDDFNLVQQRVSPEMINFLMPASPRYDDQVQTGTYTMVVDFEGDGSPCWRLTPQLPHRTGLPYRLRLRVFGVAPSLGDSEALRKNDALRGALKLAQQYFAQAGIALYVSAWIAPANALREQYATIDDIEEGRTLLSALASPTDASPADALAIDVAFVDHFSIASMLNGLAGGLPGPVALHGMRASGVVLSARLLTRYRGEEQVAVALVHEVGHTLGLRHTSAWPQGDMDALDDTPQCAQSTWNDGAANCPDAYNFMFPLLLMDDAHTWSDAQVNVMHAHPAVTQRTR